MSLRQQFADDVDEIFDNPEEFATERDFRISDGHGGFTVLEKVPVVWDEESAKKQPIVAIHGVYLGDVVCFIAHKYLPRPPVAGELIYSPANQPWEVLQCTDEESQYKLALSATRTQPGFYGNN
jgi:hypothetical protein